MAERHQQLTPGAASRWSARAVTALVLAALACGFLPVLFLGLSEGLPRFDPYLWHVLGFTLLQAGLSTLLSLLLGLTLARALSRRRFPGRALILRLLNLPLALPAIVAVIGLIAVWGEAGWLNGIIPLYGLSGILLAHVFFNAPLIARLILVELERTPAEAWRLGASLGFSDAAVWRHIEWPAIKGALPGALLLVFLLCASSFAIVLTLGGGPSATTLEVAIYQALRADFDPTRAAALSSLQVVLSCLLILAARLAGGVLPTFQPLRLTPRRFGGEGFLAKAVDGTALTVTLLLLLPPLAAITLDGLAALFSPASNLGRAILTSLVIAAGSTLLTLLLLWPLGERAARNHRWRQSAGVLVLSAWILPPAVLATGWFIAAQGLVATGSLAAPLVVLMNALVALPFAYQVMSPAQSALAGANDRLAASLGLFGWNRFRLIDLPQLARPLRLAAALAFILSLGDLTAITLFGTESLVTLPALIRQQMGGYRFDEAAGSALVLALLVFFSLALSEGGRCKS